MSCGVWEHWDPRGQWWAQVGVEGPGPTLRRGPLFAWFPSRRLQGSAGRGEARRGERRLLGAGFEARGAAPRSGLPAALLGGRLPRRPLKAEPGPCRCPCRCPCPPCRARPGHAPAVPPPQAAAASPAEPPGRHRRGARPGTRSRPR